MMTLCDGYEYYAQHSCLSLINGKWTKSHHLKYSRSYHTSWSRPNEYESILIGGEYGRTTSEHVTQSSYATKREGFKLKYNTKYDILVTL